MSVSRARIVASLIGYKYLAALRGERASLSFLPEVWGPIRLRRMEIKCVVLEHLDPSELLVYLRLKSEG